MAKVSTTQEERDRMKVAVCEYFLEVNRGFVAESGHPLIAPTAINWLGDGVLLAVLNELGGLGGEYRR